MSAYWKSVIDVLFVLFVTGILGLLAFGYQEEIFTPINMAFITVLCHLYIQYFKEIRNRDFVRWLTEYRSSERPCVTRIKSKLKNFISAGLPYWSLLYLNFIVTFTFMPFIIYLFRIAATSENLTQSTVYTILALGAMIYVVSHCFISNFKMIFRVKMNGGVLLVLFGMFLIYSKYSTFKVFIGFSLTQLGFFLLYNIWRKHVSGVNIYINTQAEIHRNGDAVGRTNSSMSLLERLNHFLWNITV